MSFLSSRRICIVLLILVAFVSTQGCDEERESVAGPGNQFALDADGLFAASIVSTAAFRLINDAALETLRSIRSGVVISQPFAPAGACGGAGEMRPTENPLERRFVFDNFLIDCNQVQELQLNTNPDALSLAGGMFIAFEDTSETLRYTVRMPFGRIDPITGLDPTDPDGVTFQFGEVAGNAIIQMTTPIAPLTYELEVSPGARHAGFVHTAGTVRLEDRTQGIVIVEVLELEYAYDEDNLEPFNPWPAGQYEIASTVLTGGFSVNTFPVDCFFDGAGVMAFRLQSGRQCSANLITFENPCSGL